MKKIMFTFVFVILLFTTSFGYTFTIINGDYTLKREGIQTGTSINFGLNKYIVWNVISGNVSFTQQNAKNATFIMPSSDVIIELDAVNEPAIKSGLTPVHWNGSKWVTVSKSNWDYNYRIATPNPQTAEGDGTAKWANAKTSDGSLFVWIPRFTYKVVPGNRVSWNGTSAGTARTYIKFSDGTEDDISDGYSKHSAFTLKDKAGNIKKELTGFWMGKFMASEGYGYGTVATVPNVRPYGDNAAANLFNWMREQNPSLGSHMVKNCEWGAVVYLTSAAGRIPNRNTSYYTAGGESSYSGDYTTIEGAKQSTTHNIYGVFDMSGLRYEFTTCVLSGGYSWTDTLEDYFNSETNGPYYVELCYGSSLPNDHAHLNWDSESTAAMNSSNPIMTRGGSSSQGGFFGGIPRVGHNSSEGSRMALWGLSI